MEDKPAFETLSTTSFAPPFYGIATLLESLGDAYLNSELLPLLDSLAYDSGDTAARFFCSGISSLMSVHTARVSSPWRSNLLAASATFAPAFPSWLNTAAAVADTRNTATTTASALSPPSSFRLRNSPIVSLSSFGIGKCCLFLS